MTKKGECTTKKAFTELEIKVNVRASNLIVAHNKYNPIWGAEFSAIVDQENTIEKLKAYGIISEFENAVLTKLKKKAAELNEDNEKEEVQND